MSDHDRTVFANNHEAEVVRYDRSGKWWIEPTNKSLPRQCVSVHDAATYALWLYDRGGCLRQGLPGGKAFDRSVLSRPGR